MTTQVEWLVPSPPMRVRRSRIAGAIAFAAFVVGLLSIAGWGKIAAILSTPTFHAIELAVVLVGAGLMVGVLVLGELSRIVVRVGLSDDSVTVVRRFGGTKIPWERFNPCDAKSDWNDTIFFRGPNGLTPSWVNLPPSTAARLRADPRFPRSRAA